MAGAPSEWQSLGSERVTVRVRQEILRWLDGQDVSPGDRLPAERELAERLGVSRPSVREAVRTLEAEGRLEVRQGRGVFVAEPLTRRLLTASVAGSDHDLAELYLMREVLDVPAALWAAEQGDAVAIARVSDAWEALEAAVGPFEHDESQVDHQQLRALDAAFHLAIVRASGNRFLEQVTGVLNELVTRGMRTSLQVPGRAEASRHEHREILDALLAGDGPAAARAARIHVLAAREAALSVTDP